MNDSALLEYNQNLNTQANTREYLVQYIDTLPITTSNSIKLQSAVLVALTQSTNQLTRQTLVNKIFFFRIFFFRFLLDNSSESMLSISIEFIFIINTNCI
jgi:hypothetical protein